MVVNTELVKCLVLVKVTEVVVVIIMEGVLEVDGVNDGFRVGSKKGIRDTLLVVVRDEEVTSLVVVEDSIVLVRVGIVVGFTDVDIVVEADALVRDSVVFPGSLNGSNDKVVAVVEVVIVVVVVMGVVVVLVVVVVRL